jgi:hypothetical protein
VPVLSTADACGDDMVENQEVATWKESPAQKRVTSENPFRFLIA